MKRDARIGSSYTWTLAVVALLTSAGETAAQTDPLLKVELGAGYDFFSHSYTLLSADTTSTLSEGSGTVNVLLAPRLETGTLEFGNRFFVGGDYTHNVFSTYWYQPQIGDLTLAAEGRWELKRYRVDGPTFANDHDAFEGALRGTWRLTDDWTLAGRARGTIYDYERRSDFFYDTRTIQGVLALRRGDWVGTWWEIEVEGRYGVAPDTTVLDHTDRNAHLSAGWVSMDGFEISGALRLDTRDYPESGPRPDRKLVGLSLSARTTPLSTWGTWADARFDRIDYGRQTLVYNNATEWRVAGGPSWNPTMSWDLRLGAGAEWHRAATVQDTTYTDLFGVTRIVDSYVRPFLFAEANLLSTGGMWLLATLEFGRHDYDAATDWDSDFYYADLMATAEVPLVGGLALQALVNFTPERHREPEDNTITNYTSLDLVWRFR